MNFQDKRRAGAARKACAYWPFLAAVLAAGAHGQGTLSAKYPRDAGMGSDPAVLFFEDFEKGTLQEVTSRYNEVRNGAGMSLTDDVPAAAAPGKGILMTSVGGTNDGGHLYKRLASTVPVLYLRLYLKYAGGGGTYHHSGGDMGGYNPPSNWPMGGSGTKPLGNERIAVRAERISDRFDFYAYWMEMRGNPGDDKFWGNTFINSPQVQIPLDAWTCVEYMIKVNSPVATRNGEMAMWINDKLVSHLGPGFPKGRWVWDKFIPDSAGQPFEGFRFRTTTDLGLNFIRIAHYQTRDAVGFRGRMWFDQVVAATQRVGCIQRPTPVMPGSRQSSLGAGVLLGPGTAVRFLRGRKKRLADLRGRGLPQGESPALPTADGTGAREVVQ